MTEIIVPVDLPTLPDRSCMEEIDRCYDSTWSSMRSCYGRNKTWIIGTLFLIIIGIIVVVVVVTQKTYNWPCITYTPSTLASSVSTACLQYIWDLNCVTKAPYTFPATYQGWWNQSPQGSAMIAGHTSQSGVGTYGNIIIYMGTCNIYYNQ